MAQDTFLNVHTPDTAFTVAVKEWGKAVDAFNVRVKKQIGIELLDGNMSAVVKKKAELQKMRNSFAKILHVFSQTEEGQSSLRAEITKICTWLDEVLSTCQEYEQFPGSYKEVIRSLYDNKDRDHLDWGRMKADNRIKWLQHEDIKGTDFLKFRETFLQKRARVEAVRLAYEFFAYTDLRSEEQIPGMRRRPRFIPWKKREYIENVEKPVCEWIYAHAAQKKELPSKWPAIIDEVFDGDKPLTRQGLKPSMDAGKDLIIKAAMIFDIAAQRAEKAFKNRPLRDAASAVVHGVAKVGEILRATVPGGEVTYWGDSEDPGGRAEAIFKELKQIKKELLEGKDIFAPQTDVQ